MLKRFLVVWFPFFATDRIAKSHPAFRDAPLVLSNTEKGRICIQTANPSAVQEGIRRGMVLADAKAILPHLQVMPDELSAQPKSLEALARWSLRFSPIVATDLPDGLIMDISGCAHLWGGEEAYLHTIIKRFREGGYHVRAAIADTAGVAWAIAHYGSEACIVPPQQLLKALQPLPPSALRLESTLLERLHKLGFHRIEQFIHIPRPTLRRRFGLQLLQRLGQALGNTPEYLTPVEAIQPYQERLPLLDPIKTATGIIIALEKLLLELCSRLNKEGKGVRTAVLKGYRLDGDIQQISIGTSRPSSNLVHLSGLFKLHISSLEPKLGFELFTLEATSVENISSSQETLWDSENSPTKITELIDNIGAKIGLKNIYRYLPAERHWPEQMIRKADVTEPAPPLSWPTVKQRPIHLLAKPERIEVMVPLPDYPPVLFRHGKRVYKLVKADGPERIEQEWWVTSGKARDYYRVEDENGARYWLFRLGQYGDGDPEWFLHGFFA